MFWRLRRASKRIVGKSVFRKEGVAKVRRVARYTGLGLQFDSAPPEDIATERVLVDMPLNEIAPIDNIRPTASYRSQVAGNLLEEIRRTLAGATK